jgi:hypothetical protein
MSHQAIGCRATGKIACAILLLCAFLSGCASSYATPGHGAQMQVFAAAKDQLSDASVVRAIARQPLASLPASIAFVRVQSPGYSSETAQGWGGGAYSVVTQRDIQNEDQTLAEMRSKMPKVKGFAPISRLLLPEEMHSDLELRQAAAALHADMVLIYTLDTSFNVQDVAAPLSVVTLGLSPNQIAHVNCTAAAVLIDTRNGYVYGIAEATEQQDQLAIAWTSTAAVDQTRKRVEGKAFAKLAGELEQTWSGVVANLNGSQEASPAGVRYPSAP